MGRCPLALTRRSYRRSLSVDHPSPSGVHQVSVWLGSSLLFFPPSFLPLLSLFLPLSLPLPLLGMNQVWHVLGKGSPVLHPSLVSFPHCLVFLAWMGQIIGGFLLFQVPPIPSLLLQLKSFILLQCLRKQRFLNHKEVHLTSYFCAYFGALPQSHCTIKPRSPLCLSLVMYLRSHPLPGAQVSPGSSFGDVPDKPPPTRSPFLPGLPLVMDLRSHYPPGAQVSPVSCFGDVPDKPPPTQAQVSAVSSFGDVPEKPPRSFLPPFWVQVFRFSLREVTCLTWLLGVVSWCSTAYTCPSHCTLLLSSQLSWPAPVGLPVPTTSTTCATAVLAGVC